MLKRSCKPAHYRDKEEFKMKTLTVFEGENSLITPVALALGQHPPATIHDQQFMVVLSGVALANFQGQSSGNWLYDTLSFNPSDGLYNLLNSAISTYNIPKPTGLGFGLAFSVSQWVPFVALSSIFDKDQSVNAGFAVQVWRPTPFTTGTDALTHQPISNIFNGVNVDVGVSDSDASILRISYNITLIGKIVFPVQPIIE
jgi:hypothetical protein